MRCTSAVVLSTLAVGQAAAANLHNRHASFHARREAAKRGADNAVNWDAVAYDLKDVKWDQINWSSVFAPTPAVKPTPTPEQKKPAPASPTPEPKKETPAPSSAKPAESPKAPEPSAKTESLGDKINDVVTDALAGVAAIANVLGTKMGKNDKSDNGGIWIGNDGKWGMEVTNGGSKNAVFYCWLHDESYTSMFIQKFAPEISVGLKPGQTISLSFKEGAPAACAPATDSSQLPLGMLRETWAEANFGPQGKFDVSRNPNMNGCNISMKGSKCTSDMNTCVFKCKDSSLPDCTYGYDLFNCDISNGGGGGYDPKAGGTGGGCDFNPSGERIKVSFS